MTKINYESYESLQQLMKAVDKMADKLLFTILQQQEEIKKLHEQNRQLESFYQLTVDKIELYANELEQIRSYYANSKHNIK